MMKHIHADMMLQYAQDAMTSVAPHKLWEMRFGPNNKWLPLTGSPSWSVVREYRRKPLPQMVSIAGHVFEAPILSEGDIQDPKADVYVALVGGVMKVEGYDGKLADVVNCNVHLSHEAAEAHCKAILQMNSAAMTRALEENMKHAEKRAYVKVTRFNGGTEFQTTNGIRARFSHEHNGVLFFLLDYGTYELCLGYSDDLRPVDIQLQNLALTETVNTNKVNSK